MYKHPVKKFLSLTILYSVIIVGIFFLQFRNESVFSKNAGQLRISLAQTQNSDGSTSLKNSLQVSFKGISFSSDEVDPATITLSNQTGSENLTLVSYDQLSPLSYKLNFIGQEEKKVSLIFNVSDTGSDASLSIQAEIPEEVDELFLPYKPASGFTVTEKYVSREILSSKNSLYSFIAAKIDDDKIRFTRRNSTASYSIYDPSTVFSFSSISPDSVIAQESTYETLMKNFKTNLISQVVDSFKTPSQLSESAVAAYISEMLSQGKYRDAVASVPESFRKGNRKTYFTAPFFGSLEAMNSSLLIHNENMKDMIQNAVESNSINIFSNEDLAEFIYFEGESQNIRSLLEMPAKFRDAKQDTETKFSVSQAFGILHTYLRLSALKSPLAENLSSVLSDCVSSIEAACVHHENNIQLVENDAPVSTLVALETGATLLSYGKFIDSQELKTAGLALTNSALSMNLDLMTMATAYQILVSNPYYPHYVVLKNKDGKKMWAWTASDRISYSEKDGVGTITTKFPVGEIQHLIVNGVAPFSKIEIYNLSYHGDARFETYNTSGFFYKENTRNFFMKSRHKTENEIIKFTYTN